MIDEDFISITRQEVEDLQNQVQVFLDESRKVLSSILKEKK